MVVLVIIIINGGDQSIKYMIRKNHYDFYRVSYVNDKECMSRKSMIDIYEY